MQHMSLNSMEKMDIQQSEHRLYTGLGNDGRTKMTRFQTFKEKLDDANERVIYPDEPPCNRPVTQNPKVLTIMQANA